MNEARALPASRSVRALALGLTLGSTLVPACSAFGGGVTRVVDGRVQDGRFIGPDAYAAYARGAQLEALEQYQGAETAYEEALALDPDSVGIWTRLGSVRCASGRASADEAFEQAARIDGDFAGLWYERGRCSLRLGKPKPANDAALRALTLDPLHLPTTTLVVETFLRMKQPGDALRYLDAAIALHPGLSTLVHWKHAIVREGGSPKAFVPNGQAAPGLEELDRALLNDTTDEAGQLALELELPEGEVAARAVALGKTGAGLERANHVHQADPADGTAWVTVLSSADLSRNEAVYEAALKTLDGTPTTPSLLGSVLFADLLKRRVGDDAARAWLRAAAAETPRDPLVTEQLRRLELELGDTHPADVTPAAERLPP